MPDSVRQKRVITIQDISCVGRCSLTVALPVLSAAGLETAILPTAILSTHTGGFEGYTFRDLSEDIEPICRHWKSLGLGTDALYTGYLGSEQQQAQILQVFADFKGPQTLVFVDPAMADNGELYPAFDLKFARGMRAVVAAADLTAPNITEACLLLGRDYPGDDYDQAFVQEVLRGLCELGPTAAVLTGVSFQRGCLGAAAFEEASGEFSYYFTEQIDGYYHGTGDIYSSVLLAAVLNGQPLAAAIRTACEFTVGAIRRTHAAGTEPRYGVDFEHELGNLISMLGL
ncbi:MAG: pyridoxamine kinase [Coriobacteriia bacterium]|nr:pyridoxamine kinase [Coriobacteriia bacterium]